jgi:hypothetical protein
MVEPIVTIICVFGRAGIPMKPIGFTTNHRFDESGTHIVARFIYFNISKAILGFGILLPKR